MKTKCYTFEVNMVIQILADNEEVAKAMIGHQLPGSIKQLRVEPYEIINDQTGEVRVFNHRSEYVPEEMGVMDTMA